MARVTVVIATYNRPQLLRHAIASVRYQTVADWRVLVIGDSCDERTGALVRSFRDPRIAYANLPARHGEQSGPNSVGLWLADTPYTAFLNHDDLWLPDHLEHAFARLGSAGADLFTGRAVFLNARREDRAGGSPRFRNRIEEISPSGRTLADAFDGAFFLFEPLSSWIVSTEPARAVGRFGPAARLYRSPLEDWLLRAWRSGLAHVDGIEATVVKNNSRSRKGGGRIYDQVTLHSGLLVGANRIFGPRRFRGLVQRLIERRGRQGHAPRDFHRVDGPEGFFEAASRCLGQRSRQTFLATGEDDLDAAFAACRLPRGWRLRRGLRLRTGEALPEPPDLDEMVAAARRQLA